MSRWKVLVVDDQKDITKNLQDQLLHQGYEVRIANSFTEALFIMERFDCDIAILDILLPDGNGIDLFRKLREKNKDIYTIMITGNATIENTITALNEGVNAYLVKPFPNAQLKAALIQAEKSFQLKAENRALFQQIVSNKQFYEDLLNSTSDAILVVDLDFRIQFCNRAAQKVLQFNEDQLKNELLYNYIEDGYKILSHIYQQLVLGKTVAGYRVGIKLNNQKSFDAHLSANFLYARDDHIEGIIVNLSNTLIHDELFHRVLRKEKLSTIVNLANALGHEIRNPINILFGRLQLLAEEIKDEKFIYAYESIKRQIDRLLKINGLLAKFNLSKEDTIPEHFYIKEILKETLARRENQIRDKQLKILTHFESKQHLIEGNYGQFADAFKYLLDAIIEIVPSGKQIEIREKIVSSLLPSQMVEILITIFNHVINPEEIYDPYRSSDIRTNSLIGLGLTIMHTVFTNYGVKIDIMIQNDVHSLIRIRLPLKNEKSFSLEAKEDLDSLLRIKTQEEDL